MDKTSKKVTEDPRRIEQGKKSYEMRMKRLKEKILEDNQPPTPSTFSSTCDPTPSTSSPICGPTPSTSSSTCDPTLSTSSYTTRSNDTYVYVVGMLAVLAIGVCVFFPYNTFPKKLVNEKQDQPPKKGHML